MGVDLAFLRRLASFLFFLLLTCAFSISLALPHESSWSRGHPRLSNQGPLLLNNMCSKGCIWAPSYSPCLSLQPFLLFLILKEPRKSLQLRAYFIPDTLSCCSSGTSRAQATEDSLSLVFPGQWKMCKICIFGWKVILLSTSFVEERDGNILSRLIPVITSVGDFSWHFV